MGGNRERRGVGFARRCSAALVFVVATAACGSSDTGTGTGTVAGTDLAVGSGDAITAIVAWQAAEQEPVIDDNGQPRLPVIFVVAGDGATIDVGVQANVAAATADWATVRFADDVADTFDTGLEGEPVRDDGALLLVGPIPEPEPRIEVDVVRYTAVDDSEPLTLEITSDTSTTGTGPDPVPRASVTAVTQP